MSYKFLLVFSQNGSIQIAAMLVRPKNSKKKLIMKKLLGLFWAKTSTYAEVLKYYVTHKSKDPNLNFQDLHN